MGARAHERIVNGDLQTALNCRGRQQTRRALTRIVNVRFVGCPKNCQLVPGLQSLRGQQAEQALFHDGKPEGSYTIWHENGQKEEEGSYHDGVLEGQVTAWDKDGHVWMKTVYKGGSLVDEAAPDPQAGANPSEPAAPIK